MAGEKKRTTRLAHLRAMPGPPRISLPHLTGVCKSPRPLALSSGFPVLATSMSASARLTYGVKYAIPPHFANHLRQGLLCVLKVLVAMETCPHGVTSRVYLSRGTLFHLFAAISHIRAQPRLSQLLHTKHYWVLARGPRFFSVYDLLLAPTASQRFSARLDRLTVRSGPNITTPFSVSHSSDGVVS